MKNLVQHIESLIIKHECVIVPGLGGFLTYHDRAIVRNNRLYAPTQRIRFNSLLTYHDGLLAEAYMQDRHISYSEALAAIKSDVEQITTSLKAGNTFLFGRIGALTLNDGNIILRDNDCKFLPENIGLPVVQLKQITSAQPKAITISIPQSSSNALRYVASIIVIFLITIFVPNPITQNTQHASLAFDSLPNLLDYRLQFSNREQVINYSEEINDNNIKNNNDSTLNTVNQEITTQQNEIAIVETKDIIDVDTEDEDVEESRIETTGQTSSTEKVEKIEKKSEQSNKRTSSSQKYHLIIASLTSLEDAEKYIANHTRFEQSDLEIIESNGKYRISAVRFDKYKEAIEYVNEIRNNDPAARKAWILCK